jgi:hypothetical protein
MRPIGKLVYESSEQGTTTDKEKEESGKKAAKRRIKLRKGIDPEVFAGEDNDKDTK